MTTILDTILRAFDALGFVVWFVATSATVYAVGRFACEGIERAVRALRRST